MFARSDSVGLVSWIAGAGLSCCFVLLFVAAELTGEAVLPTRTAALRVDSDGLVALDGPSRKFSLSLVQRCC
jgi:hypothetical protein